MFNSQKGATLIEVMIAIFILGFGLLGLAGLQARSISVSQSSYFRSIAADLAIDLSERIKALRSPSLASTDATPQPSKPPDFSLCVQNAALSPTCSAQDADRSTYQALVNSEMTSWNALRVAQLPSGSTYTLVAVQSGTSDLYRYTLTLSWLDDKKANSNTSYSVVIE
jgi:type IV pilus assembly protein PilV